MSKKTFIIFLILIAAASMLIPATLSKPGLFIGNDMVGYAGDTEQIFYSLNNAEFVYRFLSGDAVTLKDVNYPTGKRFIALFDVQLDVLMRAIWGSPERAAIAVIALYYALNAASVFYILVYVFRLNPFLAVFFSLISTAFPHFYYRMQHISLGTFFEQLMFIYFAARFIHKPGALFGFLSALALVFTLHVNKQVPYFMVLSSMPAFAVLAVYRIWREKERAKYLKSFLLLAVIFGMLAAGAAYVTVISKAIWQKDVTDTKGKVIETVKHLPERNRGEIDVWKAPPYFLLLPTSENMIFGKITGRKFQSKWGYQEKAVYIGLFIALFTALFIFLIIRKEGKASMLEKARAPAFEVFFFYVIALNFLFSIFWTLAPSLGFGDLLYTISKSARVYSRAMTLAIPCWVIIFAVLFNYVFSKGYIKWRTAGAAIMLLVLLDTVPSTLEPILVRLDPNPPEYSVLDKKSRRGDVVMDYFGRYGGYHEYGYVYYLRKSGVRTLDPRLTDGLWGRELEAVLDEYDVKYLLFTKENREKDLNEKKIKKFLKEFKYRIIYESPRSIVAKARR